jgi:thymidylate synthase
MINYKSLVADVLNNGKMVNTGKGRTKRLIGAMVRYDIGNKLPVVTGKKTNINWALIETAMFLKGEHHTDFLKQYGAEKIWEKQALSEDFKVKHPIPPADVIAKLVELKGITTEEAAAEFEGLAIAYQEQLVNIGKEFQAKEGEEVNEAGYKEAIEKHTIAFETTLTDLGLEIYSEKVIYSKGEMGPTYGAQWVKWLGVNPTDNRLVYIDQIKEILWKLENIPDSRQIILSAWNPAVIARETIPYDAKIKAGYMGQPPCHLVTQFLADLNEDGTRTLNAVLFIRSNDLALGHPFNIIGYAAILHLIAAKFNWKVGELVVQIGDAHIYENHLEGMKTYLYDRPIHETPTFKLAEGVTIDNFTVEDLLTAVGEYKHEAYMPFEINV